MRRDSYQIAAATFCAVLLGAGVILAVGKPRRNGPIRAEAPSTPTVPSPQLGRDDVVAKLGANRRTRSAALAKATSLVTRASELLRDDPKQAVDLLNRALRLDPPEDTVEGRKLVAHALVLLGRIYSKGADGHPSPKAVYYYGEAYRRLEGANPETKAGIVRSIAALYRRSGERREAERLENVASAVAAGANPPLGLRTLVHRTSVSRTTLLNPGADTCDQTIDAGTIPPNYVEAGISLAPPSPNPDHEWRSFTLASPREVRIETIGDPLLGDTNLRLWEGCSAGTPVNEIAFNEDRDPFDYTSEIVTPCLVAGTYFVDIGSFNNNGTGSPVEFNISDIAECVPLSPDEFEPDDELGAAKRIRFRTDASQPGAGDPTAVQLHTIYPADDVDFVKFNVTFRLSKGQGVRIHAGAADNSADTLLGVGYLNNGLLVGVNDDEAPGVLSSRFESCLPAGAWFAVVLGFLPTDTFFYELTADGLSRCAFESEPNGTFATADPLPISQVVTEATPGLGDGRVHGVHTALPLGFDNDFYRFTIPIERDVILETGGYDAMDVDTFLELYDVNGVLLASDDDGGAGFLSRIERVVPAGTYFVKVTLSPFDPQDTWVYSLQLTPTEPPLQETEPNDNCADANPVQLGDRVLAAIAPAGDVDHYLLSVGASSLGGIQVEAETSSGGDTVVKVFDDAGTCANQIGCNDDNVPSLNSLFRCCLPANASYVVRVIDFQSDNPIPAYSVEFRGVGECVPGGGCPIAPGQFGCP